jgi:heat-inducible transcriptional repressor
MIYELSDREKSILRYVVHQFILTANPVGSRNISKRTEIGLSPATIRNIMSDLEDSGLLGHPHTSAGRVPTDLGYRFYVDSLMSPSVLTEKVLKQVDSTFEAEYNESEELVKITSAILSQLTHQLACVTYPRLDKAVLEKIQLIKLSSTRILVVITVRTGSVRTITLEISSEIETPQLQMAEQLFNERLSGLKFSEIKKSFAERVADYRDKYKPIIRLFLDSVDKIFSNPDKRNDAILAGATNVIKNPEFENPEHLQGIIELIENKDIIIHLMGQRKKNDGQISISIGSENEDEQFEDYSLITKEYNMGELTGTVGIIGPKRMEYSKMVAAITYVAESLSKEIKKVKF